MMSYQTIATEQSPSGVLTIRMNRPEKLNTIDPQMREELTDCVGRLGRQKTGDAVRVVVLTGTGRAFCAGADVHHFEEMFGGAAWEAQEQMWKYQEIARLLLTLSMPTIASVNGIAEGGGLAIACMCDFILASDAATFSVMQGTRGIVPDVGTSFLLPRKVGLSRALEIAMLGTRFDARRALDIGLVNHVFAAASLEEETRSFAERLAERPAVSLKWIKKTFYAAAHTDLDTALELEAAAVALCASGEDFRESCRAFVEKREPVFRGR
jgi:2-(1,2-epoxy-1,2-dihydrophenyl)acetyl-CoA isomerase